VLEIGRERAFYFVRSGADIDDNTCRTQSFDATTTDARIGIDNTDDDAAHSGIDQCIDARVGLAEVRARFKGHIDSCSSRELSCRAKCDRLRVLSSGGFGRALECKFSPLRYQNASNPWIG